jgi:beta-glucanase (GH16 family)
MKGAGAFALTIAALMVCAWSPGCGSAKSTPTAPSPTPSPTPSPSQTWADEFDGPANTLPDPSKWTYDLGNNNGWGNRELETYTNSVQNVRLDGSGHLIIHVDRTDSGYTSARIKTQGLLSARYGRIEARIRLPFGQGIWPAFWALGSNITSVGWPQCGEIDIMENIGREPSINHGSVHGPGYSGGNSVTGLFTLPAGARFSDDFHVFAIQWASQTITFSVDGAAYKTVTPASLPSGASWVFENPFFLILNVAVGGNFPGNPDASAQFPQEMIVDYVRVSGTL